MRLALTCAEKRKLPRMTTKIAVLDTEFTQLNHYTTKLISLALVVPGGPEFYIELNDNWTEADCSEFVTEIVLPQLDLSTHGRTTEQARTELKTFLQSLGEVQIASDATGWDWPLLIDLMGVEGLPANVQVAPLDLSQLDYGEVEELSDPPHHALLDARLLAQWVMLANPA